ncbi:uncharacterized protein LOC108936689 [Scleropages formosus]|uniref:uncharacterized protein LOC108936689 n=1 Tax=Scleropages formosus TaxID=113540 RepID=UPI0010FA69BF|nr:uncharacterized protein LOC108936689 [Scleropages formosus]XP_018611722.2 uncharacterized protein LOC108936689 [Scleropages formosus]
MSSSHLPLRILGLLLLVGTGFGENDTGSSTTVQSSTSRTVGLQTSVSTMEIHSSANNVSGSSSSTPTEALVETTGAAHDSLKTTTMSVGSPTPETSTGKRTTKLSTSASWSSTSPTPRISETTATSAAAHRSQLDYSGYIILFLLLISIILVVMFIYFLRKKTRHYSFDLYQKGAEDIDIPLSSVGQRGVFASTQNDEKPAEGLTYVSGVPEEPKAPSRETLSQTGSEKLDSNNDDPDKVASEDSFGSQVPLTPNDKPLDFTFDLMDGEPNHSSKTSSESLEEQQNENNNNMMGSYRVLCRVDPNPAGPSETFTEISLDEPV